HGAGVVHRDLKPANILFLKRTDETAEGSEKGRDKPSSFLSQFFSASAAPSAVSLVPKITDFGLAKKLEDSGRTAAGTIMGTPSYMAPEQARGDVARVGPSADVYAL